MCVGVLTILKIGHAWEASDEHQHMHALLLASRASVWIWAGLCLSVRRCMQVWDGSFIGRRARLTLEECVCTGLAAHRWRGAHAWKHTREMCVFQCACIRVCVCVCLQPCLQGEVEADALAAGLARLSGPNLQTDRGKGGRKQIGVIVCLPPCDMFFLFLTNLKNFWGIQGQPKTPLSTFKGGSQWVGPGGRNQFPFDLILHARAFWLDNCRCCHLNTLFCPPFQPSASPLMSTLCSSSHTFQGGVQIGSVVPTLIGSHLRLPLQPSLHFRGHSALIFPKCSFISPY